MGRVDGNQQQYCMHVYTSYVATKTHCFNQLQYFLLLWRPAGSDRTLYLVIVSCFISPFLRDENRTCKDIGIPWKSTTI